MGQHAGMAGGPEPDPEAHTVSDVYQVRFDPDGHGGVWIVVFTLHHDKPVVWFNGEYNDAEARAVEYAARLNRDGYPVKVQYTVERFQRGKTGVWAVCRRDRDPWEGTVCEFKESKHPNAEAAAHLECGRLNGALEDYAEWSGMDLGAPPASRRAGRR